jgi:hypothetical protein
MTRTPVESRWSPGSPPGVHQECVGECKELHFRSVRGQTILATMYSNFVTKIKLLPPGGERLI